MRHRDTKERADAIVPVRVASGIRSRVTLMQLDLMQRVAASRNITAAGRELGLTGSLAARQIASLERALGVRLFQRTTRSVRLTEAGERVLEWAHDTLNGFADLDDSVAAMVQVPRGTVRLAVNHYAAGSYLPLVLDEFNAQYPDIRLSIVATDNLVDLVADGIDVAIHSGRIPDSSMVGIRVRDVIRVLCASPKYLEQAGVPNALEDLTKHRCLVHSSNEPLNWFFRCGDKTVGVPVRTGIEADSHNVLLELARHGLGIARLGRNIVRADIEAGRLQRVLPDYACVYPSGEVPSLWILYPNRRLLYRTRVLVDFLAERLAALTDFRGVGLDAPVVRRGGG